MAVPGVVLLVMVVESDMAKRAWSGGLVVRAVERTAGGGGGELGDVAVS